MRFFVLLTFFLGLTFKVSAAPRLQTAGKILSIETWADPEVPFVTPYLLFGGRWMAD